MTIQKIKNGISYELNGWKYISIKGNAKERGYAYGYLPSLLQPISIPKHI